MRTSANQLDLSVLPPSSRSKVRDYYHYLLERGKKTPKTNAKRKQIYRFSDICGKLSWKGDALAAQRSIRDEWA